jgi:YHS domain-containing protein
MEWLSKNWSSLLIFAVVLAFLFRRGGMGCGMGADWSRRGADPGAGRKAATPVDPVSGQAVSIETALTSAYGGRVYYFGTRENRDVFEANPERFAQADQAHDPSHHHGGHGCC